MKRLSITSRRGCVNGFPAGGLDYGNQPRLRKEIKNLAGKGYTFIKTTYFPEHALHEIRANVENFNGSARICLPQRLCGCSGLRKTI